MLHAAHRRPDMPRPAVAPGQAGFSAVRSHGSLPQLVAEAAAIHGPAPAFAGREGGTTYAALGAVLARYARYAEAEGVGRGDTGALLTFGFYRATVDRLCTRAMALAGELVEMLPERK